MKWKMKWRVAFFNQCKILAVLSNKYVANIDSVNTSVQHTKENVKELSKIWANTVKTFQQVTRDNIPNTTTSSSND